MMATYGVDGEAGDTWAFPLPSTFTLIAHSLMRSQYSPAGRPEMYYIINVNIA